MRSDKVKLNRQCVCRISVTTIVIWTTLFFASAVDLRGQANATISSINPSVAAQGSTGFSLTVSGTNFDNSSVICWNGLPRTTLFASSSLLSVTIPASDLTGLQLIQISVCGSPVQGSNTAAFTIYRTLNQVTNDLIYDPFGRRIYGSVPSSVPGGNSIVSFDPSTGVTSPPIPIGSEPGKLAISDNGQYLYVSLDGAGAVRRLDIPSQTAGLQFALGISPLSYPYYVCDLAVLPENASSVAVARKYLDVSPPTAGLGIYDDGVRRSTQLFDFSSYDTIAFSASASVLYGYRNIGNVLSALAVDSSGVTITNSVSNVIVSNPYLKFDNGRLYTSYGKVIDPATFTVVGTYAAADLVFPSGMAVDSALDRVFFLTLSGSNALIHVFNRTSFALIGRITISITAGTSVSSLVRWGDAGLAFRANDKVYLLSIPRAWYTVQSGLSVLSSNLLFPAQAVGTVSPSQSVMVVNNSASSTSITNIAAGGDFAQTNNCGSGLAPLASCTIAVTFGPTGQGNRNGTVTIVDASSGSPHVVGLSGIGDASSPVPVITGISPGWTAAGGANFQLTVTGRNFFPGCVVRWNGQDRATTFLGNQLMATITASDVSGLQTATITVFNPPPDGGTSNSVGFPVYGVVNLTTNDLIFEQFSQRIYASVPSSVSGGNSIVPIDPFRVTAASPISVGSEPGKLAVSGDGQYLYVSLGGAGAVRRVNLSTQSAGLQFSLGTNPTDGPYYAQDLEVLPDNPGAIAASRYYTSVSPSFAGVAIYDNGVKRSAETPGFIGATSIQFSASSSILYGVGPQAGLLTMSVNSSGVTTLNTNQPLIPTMGNSIKFASGSIYGIGGAVYNPAAAGLSGTFSLTYQASSVAVDPSLGRVFFLSSSGSTAVIQVFDLLSYLLVGNITVPINLSEVSDLTRWGDDGLAFRTDSSVILLRIPSGWLNSNPPLLVNPTSILFPTQPLNTMSPSRQVTLTNNTDNAISIANIGISGDFAQTNNCGSSLLGRAACGIVVTFTPTTAGIRRGTLNIADNSSSGPHVIGLAGIGNLTMPVPLISSISPTAAAAGSNGFTFTVSGSNFVSGSLVLWNGQTRPTTFVNSFTLNAAISNADLSGGGSATVTVFNPPPDGGQSNSAAFGIYNALSLATNDLIYEPFGRLVYASGTSSIMPVDPVAQMPLTPVVTGSQAGKLAVSDNGQYLYFSTNGGNAIGRLNLASQSLGPQFSLGSDPLFGAYSTGDLAVMPGNPATVAIARTVVASPSYAGVAIFDSGVQRATTTTSSAGVDVIAFPNSASTLYGSDTEISGHQFRTMSINASGVTAVASVSDMFLGGSIRFDHGTIYGTNGAALEPVSQTLTGKFNLITAGLCYSVVSDFALNRVFFLLSSGSTAVIQVFNRTDFTLLGNLTIPGIGGSSIGSLIRWGDDGLAFRSSSAQVFFLRIPASWLPSTPLNRRRGQLTSQ